jgi:iron complex transport system substrate-binding protein
MTRAGLDNMAARTGLSHYQQIPLEAVALQEADVLILNGEPNGAPSLATEALNHPIVAALGKRLKVVSMPSRLWTCAGPSVVEAVRLLIQRTSAP